MCLILYSETNEKYVSPELKTYRLDQLTFFKLMILFSIIIEVLPGALTRILPFIDCFNRFPALRHWYHSIFQYKYISPDAALKQRMHATELRDKAAG